MGQVLKARHRTMDRIVALKVLPRKAMKSPDSVKRFYREVKAAARLMHPNIVTAFDASQWADTHYLVMEYVEGQDLARFVKQHGPMAVEQAIDCIIQAARGLEYAHGEGVIHRDIKPGNLLLDRKGRVKAIGLGLARVDLEGTGEEGDFGEALTAPGKIMGTFDYIAPEQTLDSHHVDHRADIYALGCTLHAMLTARPPYRMKSPIRKVMAHREAPIPSLLDHRPDLPTALDTLFRRMLAKRPEDRPQSMDEVIASLQGC